ncbi:MAG: DUF4878 domain-containing protein [Bacteroidales bacterium]|nr:DUF4878 domain-containing protein [Bacteroidales bacterium]
MKRPIPSIPFILLLVIALLFTACGKDTPQTVATNYTEHWYKGELNAAKRYIVPEQRELVDKLASLRTAEEMKKLKNNTIEIEILNETPITDTTMTVRCRVLINGEPQTNHYHLLKVKERWYVNIY